MTQILHDIPSDWNATLAVGNNKSAKPGEWRNKKFALNDLVRGLSQHAIGPKDGPCFLQGTASDGTRQAKAMETLYIVGIDVDNGIPSTEIDKIVQEKGAWCIRYTTHSHGKDHTEVPNDEWIKYLRRDPQARIADYLIDKKHYLPEIAEKAVITEKRMTQNGLVLTVTHPAMDKNRLIFILAKPWSVHDYDTQAEALNAWKDAYMSFAGWLGIAVDKSCTDTSRLFYLPRREHEGLYEAALHRGKAIDIFSLPRVKVTTPTTGASANAFLQAAAELGAAEDDSRALKGWAAKFSDRFQIVDALEEHAPHVFRNDKDHDGIRHIECPFESGHTNLGGTATFITNAGEGRGGGFVVKCLHSSCAERDRLEFVAEMIKQDWLPQSALTDSQFLIEIEEDEDHPEEVAATFQEALLRAPPPSLKDVKDTAGAEAYLRWLAETDATAIPVMEDIATMIANLRALGKNADRAAFVATWRQFQKEVKRKRLDAEQDKKSDDKGRKADDKAKTDVEKDLARAKRKDDERKKKDRPAIFVDTDHLEAVNVSLTSLIAANKAASPKMWMFRNAGSLVRIVHDETTGYPRMERMGRDELRYELARVARFLQESGDSFREIEPPNAVVNDILANPSPGFPILAGVVTAPVFGADGNLNLTPGYSPSSQLYFEPIGGLEIPDVPDAPSQEDVDKAVDLIMGNALVDFPFDGPNNGASEKAHALCMILQPFARQLINGPTPIYLIVKPTPGTGASKLVNIYAILSTGEDAVAQTETRSEDELRKRITAVLLEGSPTFYLDNINYKIDSSALASAVTTPTWTDRLLGETKTIRVPVRHTWVFAGNNPTMSNEIARRCARIRLDAKVERPELRTDFKHTDLEAWVRANRADLIWACLTLIQHWIAQGKPAGKVSKGSFESWARVMGGVLDCAGFEGFLGNDAELRDASDEEAAAIRAMLATWWAHYGEQPATTGGTTDGLFEMIQDEDINLPLQGTNLGSLKISFGKYVGKLEGRIFTIETEDGHPLKVRVDKGPKKENKVRWKLTSIE